ncbi:MAG: hypothetical protein Q9181_003305 [Wetmoreana brouardii]
MQRALVFLFWTFTCFFLGSFCNDRLKTRSLESSGNYRITNCDLICRSRDVLSLLPQVWEALQSVLADLEHGTASRHGFRTFFKTNASLPHVKSVFQAIANGRYLRGRQPIIECLSDENLEPHQRVTYNIVCPSRISGPVPAGSLPYHGLMVICPPFWTRATFPYGDGCPAVGGRRGQRRFVDTGADLSDTQFAIIVHELMHLYNPRDAVTKQGEAYSAQDCLELDPQKSIQNAGNFALYAAGKHCKSPSEVVPMSAGPSWNELIHV